MLPKPIRTIFYKILRSGPIGLMVANIISFCFYWSVKISGAKPKQDIAGLTIISHKYKFIFFGIPKVASRSFYNLFVEQKFVEFEIEWYEQRDIHFKKLKEYPDYYSFTFVRNPWSRIVSCYNSKIKENKIGFRARIMSFYKNLKGGVPFSDFIDWLQTSEGQDKCADRHWLSQYIFLTDGEGKNLFNYVGRYETLEKDWKVICKNIGIDYTSLPQKGYVSAIGKSQNPADTSPTSTIAKRSTYQDLYDDKTRELVAQRYETDIKTFGYKYDA